MTANRSGDVRANRARQQIGPALRGLRRERGWSLDELAKRSGVSRSYLSRLEHGRSNPSYLLLSRLAGAFGVAITYFTSFEACSREVDDELSDYLKTLAIPEANWPEFSRLSLEARSALVDALRRLTAPRADVVSRESALRRALIAHGVRETLPVLRAGMVDFGLAPLDLGRSIVQVEEMPGDRLVISDRLFTIHTGNPSDHVRLLRVLLAGHVHQPALLNWWATTTRSALVETVRTAEARSIYPLDRVTRYLRTGQWGERQPFPAAMVREHIRAAIDFLREHASYHIGFVETAPPIGLLVKGLSGAVAFAVAGSGVPRGAGLRFSGPELTLPFRDYFEELWESIPPERKETEPVIAWLEHELATIGGRR